MRLVGALALLLASPLEAGEQALERKLKARGVDKDLSIRIAAAVDRASRFLVDRQAADGAFSALTGEDRSSGSWAVGSTLLCALALQKATSASSETAIANALNWAIQGTAERRSLLERYTYIAGITLALISDRPAYASVRTRLVNSLVAAQDEATGWWGYDAPGGDVDARYAPAASTYHALAPNLSTSQYAILGLRAAKRAGEYVPPRVWSRHLDGLLRTQTVSGSWPYAPPQAKGAGAPDAWDSVGYCTGTFMGICGLIASAEFADDGSSAHGERKAAVEVALQRARSALWRDGRLTLHDPWMYDPDAINREAVARARQASATSGSGAFYTLFALERSCLFAQVDQLDVPVPRKMSKLERKASDAEGMWYVAGSTWLVDRQRPDGGWASNPAGQAKSDLVDSAFALLFLICSTAEVDAITPIPPKAPPASGPR